MRNALKLTIVLLLSLVALFGFSSVANAAACIPQDAVETTYKDVENPDFVPAVEEVSHAITVVDEPAWDEQVLVTPASVIHHEAIPPTTTTVPAVVVPPTYKDIVHPATYKTVVHPEVFHVEYQYKQFITGKIQWRDTPTWNGNDNHSWNWYYTGNSKVVVDCPSWTETVVDVPEWTETVIDVEGYTIPAYDVVNDDGVDAWDETVPAVYTTINHPAVTHEEKVVDVEAKPAVGEQFITVVDVPGTPAVVCEPAVVTPTPEETVTPVVAEISNVAPSEAVAAVTELDGEQRLAETGSTFDRIGGYALAFLCLGITIMISAAFARRYDKNHLQQL